MSRPPLKMDEEIEASLRRISGALQQSRGPVASVPVQAVVDTATRVGERLEQRAEHVAERLAERHERRAERRQRIEERRRARAEQLGDRDAGAEIPRAIVFTIIAVLCAMFAVREPPFFWMLFVALGFGMSAASLFGRAAKRQRLGQETIEPPETQGTAAPAAAPQRAGQAVPPPLAPAAASAAPPQEPADPKLARIQTLCDKLLNELESGPPIVREVLTEPAATISGLRQACLETARRERELRSVIEAQDEGALAREREALSGRLAGEQDEIVRDRLGQALRALEEQLANRAELETSAARLEAENTRILYTLENLHMQLLRARTTDLGGPELGGRLRDGLRQLGTQIEAVAEALECASAPATVSADAAPASPPAAGGPTEDAQRAERADAARRAALSQQAQQRGPRADGRQ